MDCIVHGVAKSWTRLSDLAAPAAAAGDLHFPFPCRYWADYRSNKMSETSYCGQGGGEMGRKEGLEPGREEGQEEWADGRGLEDPGGKEFINSPPILPCSFKMQINFSFLITYY